MSERDRSQRETDQRQTGRREPCQRQTGQWDTGHTQTGQRETGQWETCQKDRSVRDRSCFVHLYMIQPGATKWTVAGLLRWVSTSLYVRATGLWIFREARDKRLEWDMKLSKVMAHAPISGWSLDVRTLQVSHINKGIPPSRVSVQLLKIRELNVFRQTVMGLKSKTSE